VCLEALARHFASRVVWIDFDEFLATPREGVGVVLKTLGADVNPKEIAELLAGPLVRRYSKAPEYAYDAALRQEVLAAAEREHAAQIRQGMAWLASFCGHHPLIDGVLSKASQ